MGLRGPEVPIVTFDADYVADCVEWVNRHWLLGEKWPKKIQREDINKNGSILDA